MSKTTKLMYIAMLVAQAVVISIFERFIPAFFSIFITKDKELSTTDGFIGCFASN